MVLNVTGRPVERNVQVEVTKRTLKGILGIPAEASGVVLFAHGSGSGRLSPRNQFVARSLQSAGMATLLIDLLEEDEAEDRRKVFDVRLLATRLQGAAAWLRSDPETCELPLGYFGASTGAAAALIAAAEQPSIAAVVSRGGRPDLAFSYLRRNRSQPGEQRRDVLASEMSGDGLGDEVQGATVLLAAGFNGGKHRFHE
ncbi:MAG TPA: hypothetical protein VG826_20230, partial [Pirellulales bacterium]|nr:hypothetical protein [Pirellulales bacterium]